MKSNLYVLKLIWGISPGRVIIHPLVKSMNIAYGAFYTIAFFRRIVNALTSGEDFSQIVPFLLVFTLLGLASGLISAWFSNIYMPVTDRLISKGMTLRVCEQAVRVDLAAYEKPEFYNRCAKAAEQASTRCLELLDTLANAISLAVGFALNAGFVLAVRREALLYSLVPIALIFIFQRARANRANRMEAEDAPGRRRADYARRVVYMKRYAQELRAGDAFALVRRGFEEAAAKLSGNARAHGPLIALWKFLADFCMSTVLHMGSYAYLAWSYIRRDAFALGDFMSMTGAILNLSYFVEDMAERFAELKRFAPYAENLRVFLQERPGVKSGARPFAFEDEIALRGVSFRYSGMEKDVLGGLDFALKRGETVALVGMNGAGKSTLVKLLTRLYEPCAGKMLIDGADAAEFDINSLRAGFATAFQDFQAYPLSVGENVAMAEKYDAERVKGALRSAGLSYAPEAALTREFDERGLALSRGQAQKLAAARVFYSDARIAVLDEPSASLDPLAEEALFLSLRAACRHKTLLFVSHRLSSVRFADRIALVDGGKIAELGTHAALVALDGKYAELWRGQAEKYAEGEREYA